MLPSNNIQSIVGATLYGRDTAKIGRVDQVLVDAGDGHPTWAVLHGGIFGRRNLFVPLDDARWEHDDVFVELDKDEVKNAPHPDADGGLSAAEEDELRAYYVGLHAEEDGADRRATPALAAERDDVPAAADPGEDGPKHAVDADAPEVDESVVLVQERLVVRTEQVPVARVNLDAVDDLDPTGSRQAEPTSTPAPDAHDDPAARHDDPDDPGENRPGPDRIVI